MATHSRTCGEVATTNEGERATAVPDRAGNAVALIEQVGNLMDVRR